MPTANKLNDITKYVPIDESDEILLFTRTLHRQKQTQLDPTRVEPTIDQLFRRKAFQDLQRKNACNISNAQARFIVCDTCNVLLYSRAAIGIRVLFRLQIACDEYSWMRKYNSLIMYSNQGQGICINRQRAEFIKVIPRQLQRFEIKLRLN